MTNDDKPADQTPDDEARRKFQEALERKRHREGHGSAPTEGGRPLRVHESDKRQRQFRRKSG